MERAPIESRGFTLVELMLSISVLITGITTLAGVVLAAGRLNEQSKIRGLVLAEAQSLMEELKAQDPAMIQSMYDGYKCDVEVNGQNLKGTDPSGKALVLTVSPRDAANPDLLAIQLNCGWEALGKQESMVLKTNLKQ